MRNTPTFKSMLYAGGVLFFFILLIHLTLSRPDGGIFSSVWLLIVSLFQLAFFVIGLAIGIVICIAVFLLIFSAAAFLYDRSRGREVFNKSYQAAREQMAAALVALAPGKFGQLTPAVAYGSGEVAKRSFEPVNAQALANTNAEPAIPVTVADAVATPDQDVLLETLGQIEQRLAAIEGAVQSIEQEKGLFVRTEQLEEVRTVVEDADGRTHSVLEAKIAPMQDQLEQIAKQGEELSAASKKLGDIVLRIVTLEQKTTQLAELPQQVAALRDDLTTKYETLPQQFADLKGELQKQIEAVQQQKPAAKGRARKKNATTQQS